MNNGKICVSVCAEMASDFIEKFKRATKVADVIELRFDCLKRNELNTVLLLAKDFRQCKNMTLLATFRPNWQGGKQAFYSNEHFYFWQNKQVDKLFHWADFEYDLDVSQLDLSFEKVVRSYHDFKCVPDYLSSFYEKTISVYSDIIKIAVQANDATDGLAVMKLLERAKAENRKMIPIAMGESGVWSRILGLARGAFMTFAALDDENATAPGQLTAAEMIDVYRVKELDEKTEIYGLVGASVSHSVSPHIHNAAFKFHKLNAVYVPFAVKNLADFVRRMVKPATREIDWDFGGFSVTIPHKTEIMRHLDWVDETAARIGAVNTVQSEGDRLLGYNTDIEGFIQPLKDFWGDLKNARVGIFGVGGASRAAIWALKREGANITTFARDLKKAQNLADEFGVSVSDFNSRNFKDFDVLVNATPLGTKGELERETAAVAKQLKNVSLVYDLVYNPLETRLMREAAEAGVKTIGGLSMLLAQARLQSEIWTGKKAPVKEMSQAALQKLHL